MSTNVVIEKNEEFRQFGKRITFHNVIHLIVPVVLLLLISITSGFTDTLSEDALFLAFILSYFLIIVWIGVYIKIYTITSVILYLVMIPIVAIFSWVILFHLIGYFIILVYPILFLFFGPVFNRILARSHYRANIEKTKELFLSDIQLLEESFSVAKKFRTTLNVDQITAEIENLTVRYESSSGIDEYHVSKVLTNNEEVYLFIEKPGVMFLIKISNNEFQSLSLKSNVSSVFPDADSTTVQLQKLLEN